MTPSTEVQAATGGHEHSIARLATARTAFVGRTLRGPLNRPTAIKSFAEFRHVFGGLWQPSLLGYAVEQFFDNGGREALIVRVVNGARCATLTLKAGPQTLTLRALRPGTREFLRVSIDYDNIPDELTSLFNLTVQRVRAHGTAHVEDQEIFHRLSVLPANERYLPAATAGSALLTLQGAVPTQRPDPTVDPASGVARAYVNSNADGDDGAPLTDYDLIGSSEQASGLFALQPSDAFNFLALPPLSRERDVGLSVLLVAASFCKQRRALLIVDPPSAWHTADDALRGLREWGFASENALMYFPRVLAHDKLRGHFESFAPCGAVAGMLARQDELAPLWTCAERDEAALRPGLRAACLVAEDKRARLASLGVNTLVAVRSAGRAAVRPRTLAAASAGNADWRYLAPRRLALFILNSIEHGTRWVAAAPAPAALADKTALADAVAVQVRAFLEGLRQAGSFGGRSAEEAYFAICDARVEFDLLLGFAAGRAQEFHSFRISRAASLPKIRTVTLNRLSLSQYSPAELEWVEGIASQLER